MILKILQRLVGKSETPNVPLPSPPPAPPNDASWDEFESLLISDNHCETKVRRSGLRLALRTLCESVLINPGLIAGTPAQTIRASIADLDRKLSEQLNLILYHAVEMLRRMARIAAEAMAPFIAGVSPSLLGMDSWRELRNTGDLSTIFETAEYEEWRALREHANARFIGLAMPRFLSRLPYGAKGDAGGRFWLRRRLSWPGP